MTLMVCADTPRDDVLALLTGLGAEPVVPVGEPPVVATACDVLDGAVATHVTRPISTTPTMANVRI
jgi:hypothetical protein